MPKSKLVFLKDSAEKVEYKFLVTKFEEEDAEILKKAGWGLSPELTCIVRVSSAPEVAMASFDYPPYDLKKRGGMSVNRTTITAATLFRNTPFEEIPDEVDLAKMEVKSVTAKRAKSIIKHHESGQDLANLQEAEN